MVKDFLKREDGQAAAEFALVVPFLILIICGMMDLGWIFSNKYEVEQAAYTGARYASIKAVDAKDSTAKLKVKTDAEKRVKECLGKKGDDANVSVIIDADKVTVTVDCKIKVLTYVGQAAFGSYYNAKSTDIVSF